MDSLFFDEPEPAGENKDGCINLDSDLGKQFGFTSNKFFTDSYLWKKENEIYISLIFCKEQNKGYFKELINNIKKNGFGVAIPNPLGNMVKILKKWGYKPIIEDDTDVWRKP